MAERLEYRFGDGVAVLSLEEAPGGGAGALDRPARRALFTALDSAEADGDVIGLVITGKARGFPGGLAMAELAEPDAEPALATLCTRIERFAKPVVVAMRGEVRDGGFELALAAHARVAVAGTRLALRDIRSGLVPGAGATQRLPRLVGSGVALDLLLSGREIAADSEVLAPLFAKLVHKNVVGEAVRLVQDLAARHRTPPAPDPPPGFADPLGYQRAIASRRAMKNLPPEALAMIDCVEAAQLLPLDAGLAMEAARRDDLRATIRSQGLIRTVARETRPLPASRIAGGERTDVVTVLGDGPSALVLTRNVLMAGLHVHLAEQRDGGARALIRQLAGGWQRECDSKRLDKAAMQAWLDRVTGGVSSDVLGRAELVIEACDAPVGKVAALAGLIRRSTGADVPVLLSSAAALHCADLGDTLGGRVMAVALHPAQASAALAELVCPVNGDPRASATAALLLQRIGRAIVFCPPENGLIGERLSAVMLTAAEWCIEQGATPQQVDDALLWPQGPLHRADAEGMARQRERSQALGALVPSGGLFAAFARAGRNGRAEGRGVFLYAQPGAAGDSDSESREIVARWRGAADAPLPEQDIRARIWGALFSAGLDLIGEGIAETAADVDLVALQILGLPRASGGPMTAGELRGLLNVQRDLAAWEQDAPHLWHRSDRLDEMVKNGAGFPL